MKKLLPILALSFGLQLNADNHCPCGNKCECEKCECSKEKCNCKEDCDCGCDCK